jgi:hypothetical protein
VQPIRHTDPKSKIVCLDARIETLKSDDESTRLALHEVKTELRLAFDKANKGTQLDLDDVKKMHASPVP